MTRPIDDKNLRNIVEQLPAVVFENCRSAREAAELDTTYRPGQVGSWDTGFPRAVLLLLSHSRLRHSVLQTRVSGT